MGRCHSQTGDMDKDRPWRRRRDLIGFGAGCGKRILGELRSKLRSEG